MCSTFMEATHSRLLLGAFFLSSISTSGLATVLSPSEVTSMCPGERLELTCSTTLDYIQWNVTVFQPRPDSRESFLVSDILSTTVPLTVNMIRFTVAKNSTSGSRPLISTLSVANVTAALNGTMVKCIAFSVSVTNNIEINTLVTTAHVIQPLNSPSSPELETIQVSYYETNITVQLEWTPETSVSYRVIVEPEAVALFIRSTAVQLTLYYNIQYRVSIVSTLCMQSSTIVDHFLFVKCSYPFQQPNIDESRVNITADSDLTLEGTNITFSCPPGMVLTGPTTVTCMGNGEWEPDPTEVQCKADCGAPSINYYSNINISFLYTSTLEGSLLTFWCEESSSNVIIAQCHRNASWYPNPTHELCSGAHSDSTSTSTPPALVLSLSAVAGIISSMTVLITVFLVIGFVSGYFCHKFKQSHKPVSTSEINEENKPTPIYEEAVLSSDVTSTKQKERDLEMTTNVAYGPLKK